MESFAKIYLLSLLSIFYGICFRLLRSKFKDITRQILLIHYEQMWFTFNREHIMWVQSFPTRTVPKFIIGKQMEHNRDVCKTHMCILRLLIVSPLYVKYPWVCHCARTKTAIRVLYNRTLRIQL